MFSKSLLLRSWARTLGLKLQRKQLRESLPLCACLPDNFCSLLCHSESNLSHTLNSGSSSLWMLLQAFDLDQSTAMLVLYCTHSHFEHAMVNYTDLILASKPLQPAFKT